VAADRTGAIAAETSVATDGTAVAARAAGRWPGSIHAHAGAAPTAEGRAAINASSEASHAAVTADGTSAVSTSAPASAADRRPGSIHTHAGAAVTARTTRRRGSVDAHTATVGAYVSGDTPGTAVASAAASTAHRSSVGRAGAAGTTGQEAHDRPQHQYAQC
jgi:hypothetical protein